MALPADSEEKILTKSEASKMKSSRWHMKGRRNPYIIFDDLNFVFVGSWLIPLAFGIVIGIW